MKIVKPSTAGGTMLGRRLRPDPGLTLLVRAQRDAAGTQIYPVVRSDKRSGLGDISTISIDYP